MLRHTNCHAARSRSIQKGLYNALSPGFLDSATNARNDEVERSEPGVPGLCDYARNDEVEGPTLCSEYRDFMLRAQGQNDFGRGDGRAGLCIIDPSRNGPAARGRSIDKRSTRSIVAAPLKSEKA